MPIVSNDMIYLYRNTPATKAVKVAELGDFLAAYSMVNNDPGSIAIGMPVATSGTGVKLASAGDNNSNAIGLAQSAAIPTAALTITDSGVISQADWSAITGTATLQTGSRYFLDVTAGMLTLTPPTQPGQVIQAVGRALSATDMLVDVEPSILL